MWFLSFFWKPENFLLCELDFVGTITNKGGNSLVSKRKKFFNRFFVWACLCVLRLGHRIEWHLFSLFLAILEFRGWRLLKENLKESTLKNFLSFEEVIFTRERKREKKIFRWERRERKWVWFSRRNRWQSQIGKRNRFLASPSK